MPAPARPRSLEKKFRILYLGSDWELVKALRKAFLKPDYRLVTCADRGTARLFLKSEILYDLLLIDLQWRDGEGLKLARLTHSKQHRKQIRIALLAATELSDEMRRRSRRAGVTDWVTKTPDMAEVAEAIKKAINRSDGEKKVLSTEY